MSNTNSTSSRASTRQDRRLNEERRAGRAPLAVDSEGNKINPHIPHFISQAPWYADDETGVTLSHQRLPKFEDDDPLREKTFAHGKLDNSFAATKYRKGACENCGALTHATKQCLERPRKKGAKWTGQDIQADELIPSHAPTWDSKRDQWAAFNPEDYKVVYDEYKEIESKGLERLNDLDKINDEDDRRGQMSKNLRIREDKAKYLLDLKEDSNTVYNPKSRTLRNAETKRLIVDDDFVRSEDVEEFEKLQRFAWQTNLNSGKNIHVQANPTAGELEHKQHRGAQVEHQQKLKNVLSEKYGVTSANPKQPPKELLNVKVNHSKN